MRWLKALLFVFWAILALFHGIAAVASPAPSGLARAGNTAGVAPSTQAHPVAPQAARTMATRTQADE